MKYITAFFMAWGNFCSIPCPCKLWDNSLRRLQLMFIPIIGIVIGGLWYLLYIGLMYTDLPFQLQAVALTIYPFLVSGCIHLDGFMDCSDAILSRRDLEERQRILKDSAVGAFAVISVIMLFLIVYGAMEALLIKSNESNSLGIGLGLVAIPVASRCFSSYGVLHYKPIGHSQYKGSFDKAINLKYEIIMMLMFAVVVTAAGISGYTYVGMGFDLAIVAAVTGGTHFLTMLYGRTQLGGMSGDVAGYAMTTAECAGLLTLVIL